MSALQNSGCNQTHSLSSSQVVRPFSGFFFFWVASLIFTQSSVVILIIYSVDTDTCLFPSAIAAVTSEIDRDLSLIVSSPCLPPLNESMGTQNCFSGTCHNKRLWVRNAWKALGRRRRSPELRQGKKGGGEGTLVVNQPRAKSIHFQVRSGTRF